MARKPHSPAFYITTSVAILAVAAVWVWNLLGVVQQGVAGAHDVLSTVASTASDVKQQSAPDPATVDAIKQGLHRVVTDAAHQQQQQAQSQAQTQATVDAVAQIMSKNLTTNNP